jgi:hypothetical protein
MRVASMAVVVLVGFVASGCGGATTSNGEAKKSASQVLRDAKAVVRKTLSLHVVGRAVEGGEPTSIEVSLSQSGGGGRITAKGATIQMVRARSELYLKADRASWLALTRKAAVANLFADRWIKAPADTPDFAGLAGFLDIAKLADDLKPEGAISKLPVTKLNGRAVIPLVDATGSTLYVAAEGPAYIVKVVNTGKSSGGAGTFTLDHYGSATTPPVPTNAVDLSQLKG